jgi:hypothetical protein
MLEVYQQILDGKLDYAAATSQKLSNPIGIGAVGGSGTRLLLQIMADAGVAMASPLNRAGDAYEWPPYQKLLAQEMTRLHDRDLLIPNILHAFEQLLIQRQTNLGLQGRIGWKVPGTFHWLRELGSFFPGFQYLHLMRNGLDMAYSGNQNQIKNWAGSLGVEIQYDADGKVLPSSMLEYWLTANETAQARANTFMPGRMLVIRFEDLCQTPQPQLQRIFDFLSLDIEGSKTQTLAQLVKTPGSVGRYQSENWQDDFSEAQLQRLQALGYTP